MSKNNIRFLWDNTATDTATLTASASETGWPVEFLQHYQPKKAWKCPDPTGSITIQYDEPQIVTALALVGHNLGVKSRVTLRAYEEDLVTEKFSEEFEVVKPVYTAGELLPCSSDPFGYPTNEQLGYLPRTTTAVMFPRYPLGQHKYKIEIDNNGNDFHIGRLVMGRYFAPSKNLAMNWTGGPIDESKIEYSVGGQFYADIKKKRNQFQFQLGQLTESEAFGALWSVNAFCGVSRPLVVCMAPDNMRLEQYTSIYCRLKKSPQPACVRSGLHPYSTSYSIEEVL